MEGEPDNRAGDASKADETRKGPGSMPSAFRLPHFAFPRVAQQQRHLS